MRIGIDIGGSHVGIGLVDEFGNIQQKKEKYIVEKIENESQISKKNLKEEITQFIIQTIKEYQKMDFVENVGIAVPGTVNQTTIIKAVNLGIENYDLVIAEVSKFATILPFFIVKTPLFFIPPKTFAVIVLLFKLMVTFLLTSKLTELFSNKTISSFSFAEFIASCKEE